jgi:hypothetical protein
MSLLANEYPGFLSPKTIHCVIQAGLDIKDHLSAWNKSEASLA